MTAGVRCVIYLRVSTSEQAEGDLTEEGFSIPAQREACLRHISELGGGLVDEYSDRGESARSADRPQLQAMLRRITEDRDVDAVVVHKIDRLARNIEHHVAIRSVLRRCGVVLVSVTEKLEETASGRLVEASTPSWPSSTPPTSGPRSARVKRRKRRWAAFRTTRPSAT